MKNITTTLEAIDWETTDRAKIIEIDEDKTLFSDDTGIAFDSAGDIIPKLQTYDHVTSETPLLVNWEKAFILTNGELKMSLTPSSNYARQIIKSSMSKMVKYWGD